MSPERIGRDSRVASNVEVWNIMAPWGINYDWYI
jgi:hypothetical protein